MSFARTMGPLRFLNDPLTGCAKAVGAVGRAGELLRFLVISV